MNLRVALSALALLLACPLVGAHEVKPAYLRIAAAATAESPDTFDILWRVPTGAEIPLLLSVELPTHCAGRGEAKSWREGAVAVERRDVSCPGGLVGGRVTIAGLESSVTDVLVRFERADGTTQVARLTPTAPSFVVTDAESWSEVATTYLWLGVEHILLGIDHLLFVLALLMIVDGWRKLVATVTSFTVAHSLTLAAAALGWVAVPQAPVEAVIALSIMFVCAEIVHWRQGRPGIARSRPWIVAFTFGLLHGFGFAGALADVGLPEHAIPIALLFFNVGVELGQLAFIAVALVGWRLLRDLTWPAWAWRVPVYGIGALAGFWTIERIAGFAPAF